MSIFISHSSNNSDIVESFVSLILIEGLGIEKKQIFCTSIQEAGIKSGEDFKIRIKKELEKSKYVIQIISEEYRNSEVCLNEMGAAWALNKKVIPFILPPVSFDNVGFIHMSTQLIRLNEEKDLDKFYIDYGQILGNKSVSKDSFSKIINRFINQPELRIFNFPNTPIKINDKEFGFFNQYLNPDINHYNLMIKAQPNLADCKAVFRDEVYTEIYSLYSIIYKSSLLQNENWDDIYTKDEVNYREIELFNLDSTTLKGILVKKYMKTQIPLYSIEFKNKNDEYGVVFHFWTKINGRWVFFPKPLRVIRTIEEAKNSKILKRVLRWFKFLGIKKDLKSANNDLEYFISYVVSELKK